MLPESETPETKSQSLRKIQQEFANNYGFQNKIIWDLLSSEQGDLLKDKLKHLIPDQKIEKRRVELGGEQGYLIEYKLDHQTSERRDLLFQQIWTQRKYTNGNSLTAIIFVLLTKETDFNKAADSTEFSCHPIIRTRKCVSNSNDSENCCMIFIDETGRIYQHWDSFLLENTLPAGTMIVPRKGIYTFDERGIVNLDIYATPASSASSQVLAVADTTMAAGGFLSACLPLAAVASIPVAAPLLAVAFGVGLASAGYSAIRSGVNLVDRRTHEQSISLTDSQARNSWIGIAAGAVGLGATGATRAMSSVAAAGREVSLITEVVVNGMNISSIVLSGTGVVNGAIDIILRYRDDDDISTLEIVQMSASLVLFTHSVYNFRLASRIINDSRNESIASYRKGLSNRQRRMFDKMSKETIRINGETHGKMDIIRSVNDIPSKQFLNDFYKINKNLNQKMIRPSFSGTAGDPIVLNKEIYVDSQQLRASVQHNVGPDILGTVTQPIPSSFNEVNTNRHNTMTARGQLLFSNSSNNRIDSFDFKNLSGGVKALISSEIVLPSGAIILILEYFGKRFMERITNAESFEAVITTLASIFTEESFRYLIRLARRFVENILETLESILKIFISAESVLYRILTHCKSKYVNISLEYLAAREDEIIEAIREYFLSLNPNSYPDLLKKCNKCNNFFAEKQLN